MCKASFTAHTEILLAINLMFFSFSLVLETYTRGQPIVSVARLPNGKTANYCMYCCKYVTW